MEQTVYSRHIDNEKEHWWFAARREIIYSTLKNFNSKNNQMKILDFGSGSGTNIKMLCQFGKVDVFETNSKMRDYLKKKFKRKKNVTILNSVKKNSYDLILAADVIEHIKNDKKVLKEFFSYLKKGGVILITVPAFEFLFSSKDRVLKHFRRYRKSSLTKLVKKNFLIKKISYFNFFLFFPIAFSILYLKLKNSKFINFAESTPNYFVNLLLKKIFSAEKYFLRNINFPFGISLLLVAKKND
jgi:2-polyprenyl-3-methyl-5-hydroxy-6-metoxy-1,4-benzoquinol methylase